jgi:hypothetical protein
MFFATLLIAKSSQIKGFLLVITLATGLLATPVNAYSFPLTVTDDKSTGYNRNLFKHWIDANKDGCNTRAEVLIEEAKIKPKVGLKCKLTGGEWFSSYDGKTITKSSLLDVDHMVPLAEAWRSGAWKWTPAQRQEFANDLDLITNSLVAVSASSNRSKGDRDPASWLPKMGKEDVCQYLKDWIDVKWKYSLTVDQKEAKKLQEEMTICFGNYEGRWLNEIPKVIGDSRLANLPALPTPIEPLISYSETTGSQRYVDIQVSINNISGFESNKMELVLKDINRKQASYDDGLVCRYNYGDGTPTNPAGSRTNVQLSIPTLPISFGCSVFTDRQYRLALTIRLKSNSFGEYSNYNVTGPASSVFIPKFTATPIPTPKVPSAEATVTPGSFCSPAGSIGKSASGVEYTCQTSATDTRNRWRR